MFAVDDEELPDAVAFWVFFFFWYYLFPEEGAATSITAAIF